MGLLPRVRPHVFDEVTGRWGFSPVCVRMCVVRPLDIEKALPHVSQRCGFSPVCVRMCAVSLPDSEKTIRMQPDMRSQLAC